MYIHIFDACIIEKFSGSIDIYNVFGYRCKKIGKSCLYVPLFINYLWKQWFKGNINSLYLKIS